MKRDELYSSKLRKTKKWINLKYYKFELMTPWEKTPNGEKSETIKTFKFNFKVLGKIKAIKIARNADALYFVDDEIKIIDLLALPFEIVLYPITAAFSIINRIINLKLTKYGS